MRQLAKGYMAITERVYGNSGTGILQFRNRYMAIGNSYMTIREQVYGNLGTGTWQLGNRYMAIREQVHGN